MQSTRYDVVVLGVGGMGAAALYHLAKRGLTVCGVEAYAIAHPMGSSYGESRIIRKAYSEHPDYIPLIHRAYALWDELAAEVGKPLREETGLVLAGPPDSEVIKGLDLCYRTHPLPHEKLSPSEAQSRYPMFRFQEDDVVYFDPLGGYLRVEDCVAAHAERAAHHGATLYTTETVLSWQVKGPDVEIVTDRRRLLAGRLVITAGAWAAKLLRSLGISLRVLRKVLLWYQASDSPEWNTPAMPCYLFARDGGVFYGFPAIGPDGLKVAEHTGGEEIEDPATISRDLMPADEERVLAFLAKTLPAPTPHRTRFSVCMYTMTPDAHFILDRHPVHPQVVLGAGFSGHGFKFASVVGEILADLATEGKTHHPIEFLRLGRFEEQQRRG